MKREVRMAPNDDPIIQKLTAWGEARDDVRAAILTSTRAATGRPTDEFSDYDVIYVVRDVRAYLQDAWLGDFGEILNVYRDPVRQEFGQERFTRVTQYADGLKIDFSICSTEWLRAAAQRTPLPAELDAGYAVLLDRDGVAGRLPPFTRTAFLPVRPTEAGFREAVMNFFNNAGYVAKYICRDDLLPLMEMQHLLRSGRLRQVLEWQVAAATGWAVPNGAHGRGLAGRLDERTRAELAAMYAGPGKAENWESLFRAVSLYQRVARGLAKQLGFTFPEELFERNVAYLRRLRKRDAEP
jgi:aminoglycoside 6-adenylyltransferase